MVLNTFVNLIMDKEIVKELIQNKCNKNSIRIELNKILTNYSKEIKSNYIKLISILGKSGTSKRIAEDILKLSDLKIDGIDKKIIQELANNSRTPILKFRKN